jgi:hypothetical protein
LIILYYIWRRVQITKLLIVVPPIIRLTLRGGHLWMFLTGNTEGCRKLTQIQFTNYITKYKLYLILIWT